MMNETYDTVIIGGGLAGICSALHLCSHEKILVVDAADRTGGASAVATGLVNPFMALRARPVWRHREALEALAETIALAGAATTFDTSGVFRPASDEAQVRDFQDAARADDACSILTAAASLERWELVRAPLGGLLVRSGGAVDIPAFLAAASSTLSKKGVAFRYNCCVTSIHEESALVRGRTTDGDTVSGRRLLLAAGAGLWGIDGVGRPRLHRIKGQTVVVSRQGILGRGSLPHLAGLGYVVSGRERVSVGSSYSHDFQDLQPDERETRAILQRAADMVPGIDQAPVIRELAAVRVTVPVTRLPMVGPLPDLTRVWIFSGLGSKGLLMAPLMAKGLPGFFGDPETIPGEVRVP